MLYQWQFRPYHRRFKQALQTNHGTWIVRDGIMLRLVDEAGNIGWGEIAPIPWFGSETVEQALTFCYRLPSALSDDRIFAIPDTLPCCQFAFESAWEGMKGWAIDQLEPQRRRDAENRALFATEKATFQAQNLDVAALNLALRPQNSIAAPQNSALRPQSSALRPQSSALRPQSSIVVAQNSTLRPQNLDVAVQNSIVGALNSDIAALNSTLRPQNVDVAVQNSALPVQNSTLRPQNSILRPQDSKPEVRFPSPLLSPLSPLLSSPYSALLPAGSAALHAWKALWIQGFRTFKWKIGVSAIAAELEIFYLLAQSLPQTAKLRLDANGGLSTDEAAQWLQHCDTITANPDASVAIEYIEQPLNTSQFQAMQDLSNRHRTPIALDESVATLQQLQACYKNGWRGISVIKPAIVGSPSRLRQFCQTHAIDAVFSSAFETAIGRQAGLRLAAALGNPDRAVGYGTTHWFDDSESDDFEQLWLTL